MLLRRANVLRRGIRIVYKPDCPCATSAGRRLPSNTPSTPTHALRMASSLPSETSLYATGPFAVSVPRKAIAAITAAKAPSGAASTTTVSFVTKEALPALAEGGALAAADAEHESVLVGYKGGARAVTASLGKKATLESLRKAAVAAVNKLRALKVTAAEFVLPAIDGVAPADSAGALTQAVALGNFAFDRYLSGDKAPTLLRDVAVVTGGDDAAAAAVDRAATLANATIFARDLSNERADEIHPGRLEAIAAGVATEIGAALHVVRGDQLVTEGLHMLAAVGQAARHPGRYVELLYKGDPEHPEDVIMVLGKGITFDSGGLNMKGTGFMEDMHMDMSGSAVVLGTALATHRLGVKRNVLFVLAVAENAVDAHSFKPHNIIRSHKGLTVEIGNTDAEGRLVLADALSYAQRRHAPHTIIDLATLTGACVVALGEYAAGCFSNSSALSAALVAAGAAHGERLWPMPILPEHREELTSTPFADLKSTGAGRYGGACTAAAFLENFLGADPAPGTAGAPPAAKDGATSSPKPAWSHLDIAGPAMVSRDMGVWRKGGTGFGVHAVTQYLATAPRGRVATD